MILKEEQRKRTRVTWVMGRKKIRENIDLHYIQLCDFFFFCYLLRDFFLSLTFLFLFTFLHLIRFVFKKGKKRSSNIHFNLIMLGRGKIQLDTEWKKELEK